MQLHTSYKKKNIYIFFSFGVSLNTWAKKKILEREVKYYQELKKDGYNITFVTYGDNSDLKFRRYLKAIKVIPLFKYIKKNFFTKYLIFLIAPIILKKELESCDLIKTHQITGGLLAVLCSKIKKKKLIIRAGWEPTENYKKWDISFIKYLFLKFNSFLSYKLSNRIIVTSNKIKIFIHKKYNINNKKITVIPNSINIKKFKNIKTKKYLSRAINISRLESQKNLFTLLKLCKISDLELDVVGSGVQLKELKQYAKKIKLKVRFLGQINNNDLPNLLSRYILYVTTSKIEGSPKSIMEAMSVGLPIFGLKANGLNSLITNGKTGYLFSDLKNLSNQIIKFKKNLNILKNMGSNARKEIIKNFNLNKNISYEKEIFENLINEKKY